MKWLFLLAPLLFLAGCGDTKDTVLIRTPSGAEIKTTCPGDTSSGRSLCQETRLLAERNEPLPSYRALCPRDARYYSLQGDFVIDGEPRQVVVTWDCNTILPLEDLYDAVQERTREELGSVENSDYPDGAKSSPSA